MPLFTPICPTETRDQIANARPKREGVEGKRRGKVGGWVDQSKTVAPYRIILRTSPFYFSFSSVLIVVVIQKPAKEPNIVISRITTGNPGSLCL